MRRLQITYHVTINKNKIKYFIIIIRSGNNIYACTFTRGWTVKHVRHYRYFKKLSTLLKIFLENIHFLKLVYSVFQILSYNMYLLLLSRVFIIMLKNYKNVKVFWNNECFALDGSPRILYTTDVVWGNAVRGHRSGQRRAANTIDCCSGIAHVVVDETMPGTCNFSYVFVCLYYNTCKRKYMRVCVCVCVKV